MEWTGRNFSFALSSHRVPRTDLEAFVSCCKDTPSRLWDLSTGSTSSYISMIICGNGCNVLAYDHVDQVMTPMSCRVLRSGSTLLGGYRKYVNPLERSWETMLLFVRSLRAFDLERPGREIHRIDEIHGIVSTIDDDYANTIAVRIHDMKMDLFPCWIEEMSMCLINSSLEHSTAWYPCLIHES